MIKFLSSPIPKWLDLVVTLLFSIIWLWLIAIYIKWFPHNVQEIVVNIILFGYALIVIWLIVTRLRTPYGSNPQSRFRFKPAYDVPTLKIILWLLILILIASSITSIVWSNTYPTSYLIVPSLSALGLTLLKIDYLYIPTWLYQLLTLIIGLIWLSLIFTLIKWFPHNIADIFLNLTLTGYVIFVLTQIIATYRSRQPNKKIESVLKKKTILNIMLWSIFFILIFSIPIAVIWPERIPTNVTTVIVAGIAATAALLKSESPKNDGNDKKS